MAEKLASIERLLNCSVCGETFTEPASLSCKHSFCSECLQKNWQETQSKNCPVCKRRSSKDIVVNFALQQLADSFADRQSEPSEKPGSPAAMEEVETELVCRAHNREKMFCEDDHRALCDVCEFPLHKDHTLIPVEEAVTGLKRKLESDLTDLKDKQKNFEEIEENYRQAIENSTEQVLLTEREIRAMFQHRHDLLKRQERSRVASLWDEERQRRTSWISQMTKVQHQAWSLSTSIAAVEEELLKDPLAFLNSYKVTQRRARHWRSQPDPQLVQEAPIDVAKYLGTLSLTRERKIKDRAFTLSSAYASASAGRAFDRDPYSLTVKKHLLHDPEGLTQHETSIGSKGFGFWKKQKEEKGGGSSSVKEKEVQATDIHLY